MAKIIEAYDSGYTDLLFRNNHIITLSSEKKVKAFEFRPIENTVDNIVTEDFTGKIIVIDGIIFEAKNLRVFFFTDTDDKFVTVVLIYEDEKICVSEDEEEEIVPPKYVGKLVKEDGIAKLEIEINFEYVTEKKKYYEYTLTPPKSVEYSNFYLSVMTLDGTELEGIYFSSAADSVQFHIYDTFIRNITGKGINEHFGSNWVDNYA
jgi:hypothetical protein